MIHPDSRTSPEARSRQAVTTLRIAVVIAVISAVSLIFYIGAGWMLRQWQFFGLAVSSAVLLLASGMGAVWARNGRVEWGILSMVGASVLVIPVASALVEGLGLILMVTLVAAMTFTAMQNLSPRAARLAILASLISGVLALLIDVYGLPNRLQIPAANTFILLAAGLLVAVFGVLMVRQFGSFSLQAKLLLAFLLVTLSPLVGLGYLNNFFSQNNLTTAANRALLAGASQAAAELDVFIADRLESTKVEASLPAFVNYLAALASDQTPSESVAADIASTIRALALNDPQHIEAYALLDRAGIIVFGTQSSANGTDESGRDYFFTPMQTGLPFASPVEYVRGTGAASMFFSAPVKSEAGETLGVLRVRYTATLLQDALKANAQRAGAGAKIFAILLDERHVRLAHTSDPTLLYKSVVPMPADTLAQLQAEGFMPPGSPESLSTNIPALEDGLRTMSVQPNFTADLVASGVGLDAVAAARLTTRAWVVVYAQPQDEFLLAARNQTRLTLLLALLLAGGAVVVAIVVAQRLAAPITRLTQAAAQVAAGNLHARARVETQDEIGALASAFNAMTAQLRETLEGLERRVADRTRALAASAEVSRRLSTILDQRQLVQAVVDQIQQTFNYYHAHIYLFDEGREHLVMVGGTGEVGRQMLATEHKIPRGRGLVGRAADTNSAVVVPDVMQAVGWLPNPLLPDTKAEVAVPIAVGGLVLGVLDVQHNRAGGLTTEDAELIQSVAHQVAIALQNSRSYRQTQRQAELETLINTIGERIQGATSVESAMQVAVREVGRALQARETRVRLMTSSASAPEREVAR